MSQTSPSATVWHSLGGYLTSAPAGTVLSDGSQIGLFVAGTNGASTTTITLHVEWLGRRRRHRSSQARVPPRTTSDQPGSAGLSPAPTASSITIGQGRTSGYERVGGALTSSPSAAVRSTTLFDVFARGSTGQFAALYQITYNSGTWGIWTAIGGV